MKLITFCSIISFLSISPNLVCQDKINDNIFENVELGSHKFYSLLMNDGSKYHARIISVDDKMTLINTPRDESFFVITNDINRIKKKPFYSFGSIGFGIGISYGGLGANMDIHIIKGLHITGGIGTLFSVPLMYNVGCKYWLRSEGRRWQPRVSIYYGKNRILNSEAYSGFSIGIGQQWALAITKAWAFDFDLYYVFNQKMQNRIDELINDGSNIDSEWNHFDASIGLRYCF